MKKSKREFYEIIYDLLNDVQEEVSEVIQHLDYLQSKLGLINTNLLIKQQNELNEEIDSK